MSNMLEENEIHLNENVGIVEENINPVGLYKVVFELNGIERYIDLLLNTRRKKKSYNKLLISSIINLDFRRVIKVKLRFRKRIEGFSSGIEGT
jgi:hypothetical protein